MTMSNSDPGISPLTPSIPHLHFISAFISAGPRSKGQPGLRYQGITMDVMRARAELPP
jgi:hypothetical protein